MPQCFLCVKNRSALTHSIAGFLFVDAEICPKGTKQQQKKFITERFSGEIRQ